MEERYSIVPGIYRHYKGNLYEVYGVATHSETAEEFVVYRALYGDYQLIVRPRAMFFEWVTVTPDDDINRRFEQCRFELVKSFS
jgi:hypothetical protein